MPALAKTRPTEERLTFRGPREHREQAIRTMRELGFEPEAAGTGDWRSMFPALAGQKESALALRGARTREGLTQAALAERTGIPQRHISEMETGRRDIGKERARRLAEALRVDYRILL